MTNPLRYVTVYKKYQIKTKAATYYTNYRPYAYYLFKNLCDSKCPVVMFLYGELLFTAKNGKCMAA